MTSALIDRLRTDLASAHYSVSALTGLWGSAADAALHRNQRVPALRALAGLRHTLGREERSATLARLFVLGLPVERSDLDAALPTLGTSGAIELGLVGFVDQDGTGTNATPNGNNPSGDSDALVGPLLELRPYSFIDGHGAGSWWIVSDLGELALGHALGENHVLGVGGASLTLAGLMIPNPVDSALDLGTGCGIQAMHAARHATHVVATDISERALELAALNAELNGIRNIEFRLGSLFAPVAGERFDHIISNPPFVITPRTEGVPSYEYRDGGLVGDAIVEAVVRGAAAHLNPGGIAQLLGNWEYHDASGAGGDAFDRLRSWLDAPRGGSGGSSSDGEGDGDGDSDGAKPAARSDAPGAPLDAWSAPLDAWIIEREVQGATDYAETWIRDGGTRPDTAAFDRLYGAWLDDFEARGVSKVGFGYMLLRAPQTAPEPERMRGTPSSASRRAEPLRRLERLHDALGANAAGIGSHLAACLQAHDWQVATDDAQLAASHLTVAPDVTEERHYWPGHDDPTLMTLHQGGGFGRSVQLDTALAALIGACDGDLAVGAIIAALAQLLEADETDLRVELLPRVRELLDDGFVQAPA
ncbi:MAG: methyltransferase [Leifsonia sp.]